MKNISFFLSENFQFLELKFSVYLNRRVFVMLCSVVINRMCTVRCFAESLVRLFV